MALNWSLNFFSAQYLPNTFAELDKTLHMLWYRPAVVVTCQFSPTCNFWRSSDVRIPFPLDIVRTNGWNFTQFYICNLYWQDLGFDFTGRFYKFVTELWALIDILKHEMHYSEAIVRFSELISQRRIGRSCSNLMCIVKRWRTVEHYLRTALSTNWFLYSKLTYSFLSHFLKYNIYSPSIGIRPFWSGTSFWVWGNLAQRHLISENNYLPTTSHSEEAH